VKSRRENTNTRNLEGRSTSLPAIIRCEQTFSFLYIEKEGGKDAYSLLISNIRRVRASSQGRESYRPRVQNCNWDQHHLTRTITVQQEV
jgi:hypothetical protein